MELDVVFVGTSGSVPTARRGAPSVLVRRGGDRFLVDCGEGPQRQLLRSTVGLVDVLEGSGLCKSKGDARRQIAQGAVRLGAGRDDRVEDPYLQLTEETVVWKGKKNCVRVVTG